MLIFIIFFNVLFLNLCGHYELLLIWLDKMQSVLCFRALKLSLVIFMVSGAWVFSDLRFSLLLQNEFTSEFALVITVCLIKLCKK